MQRQSQTDLLSALARLS